MPGPFSVPKNQDNEKDAETRLRRDSRTPGVHDLSQYPITRRGDDITIGTGNPTHVVDITVSEEEYEAIKQAIPEEPAYDPLRCRITWVIPFTWIIRNIGLPNCGKTRCSSFLMG